jgi:hypothetical protein
MVVNLAQFSAESLYMASTSVYIKLISKRDKNHYQLDIDMTG